MSQVGIIALLSLLVATPAMARPDKSAWQVAQLVEIFDEVETAQAPPSAPETDRDAPDGVKDLVEPQNGDLSPDRALVQACLNGDAKGIDAALARGARLETRHGERGLTPLMLAIYRDHITIAKLLLERGADPNASNLHGHTPLIMAAAGGQGDLAKMLLARGARVDAAEEGGNTALMWAAYWGHLELVELLLAQGARADLRNDESNHALLLAALGGVGQQSRQLVNAQRRTAKTGRRLPVVFDDREATALTELLLRHGALADLRNASGQSALMLFAGRGQAGPVQRLLAAGASRTARDHHGLSASDYARRAGFPSLARELNRI